MKIKRRTLVALKIWVLRILILTIVTGVWYGYFLTPTFTITDYQVEGIEGPLHADITTRLYALGEGYSYKVIPRGKILTYSSKSIRQMIQGVIPEASEITIRQRGLHTLRIEIKLFTPDLRISDTQALTKDGIIFTTSHDIRSYPLLSVASSTTRTIKHNKLVVTELILPENTNTAVFLEEIMTVVSKINSVIFPVRFVTVEDTGDVTCFNENKKSKVIFSKNSDTKKVWSTLVSAIDTDPLKTKLVTEKDRLEYLDVRYGNKVFYRFSDMAFQNGSVTGIIENHATTTQASQEAVPGQH